LPEHALQSGANVQKIFSYGHRNGFGMAFDPLSGNLWETENADSPAVYKRYSVESPAPG